MPELPDIADTKGRYCPCCDRHVRKGFEPGPDGRPDARCPHCRSLERHRFFAVLLGVLSPELTDVGVLLDVAPSPHARKRLLELGPRSYVRLDISPWRGIDLRGDLTRLPLRDGCVDLIHCYHVLEHVPDDAAAIRELARVLAPDGLALVQVPWRPAMVTDEDPSAGEEERIRRFGQADHVRYYGGDFEDRLVAGGLSATRITPHDFLGEQMNTWMGLGTDQSMWLVRSLRATKPAATRIVPDRTPLTATLDAALRELARVRLERKDAVQQLRALSSSSGENAG
ncbi:hypothetical protein BH11ACT8_BH11ACT8_31370 [soil metagenome]